MTNKIPTTLIIDTSLHAMRYLHGAKGEDTEEEGWQWFRHNFLNSIFEFIRKFDATEVIMAVDSRNNWRKTYFPYYKSKRSIKRRKIDEEDHPWFEFSEYFNQLNKLVAEIEGNLPFKVVEVDYAEADDVAGVLVHSEQLEGRQKIVVTADQDYMQLLKKDQTKIYNPVKKEFMHSKDPHRDLLEKICLGDSGDDIPSIKDRHVFKPEFFEFCVNEGYATNEEIAKTKIESSEEDFLKMELAFYDKYYLKPCRSYKFPKKLFNELMNEDALMEEIQKDPETKKRFKRNNKLINLTAQPKDLQRQILEKYDKCETMDSLKHLFNFFVENSFNDFLDNQSIISESLKPLLMK